MISDLSPGDRLSLKGKLFELQKKLTILDLEQRLDNQYSYQPQIKSYELPNRPRNIIENSAKAEIIRQQKKKLLQDSIAAQAVEPCTFTPKIYTSADKFQHLDSRPVHVRLSEKAKEYRESKERMKVQYTYFDDSGRKLFSPEINRGRTPTTSVNTSAVHSQQSSMAPPVNTVSAEEFLYQDAKDREIRHANLVLQYQTEAQQAANTTKINLQSLKSLKERACKSVSALFTLIDTNADNVFDYQDFTLYLERTKVLERIELEEKKVEKKIEKDDEATKERKRRDRLLRNQQTLWNCVDHYNAGVVYRADFQQLGYCFLMHKSPQGALKSFRRHEQRQREAEEATSHGHDSSQRMSRFTSMQETDLQLFRVLLRALTEYALQDLQQQPKPGAVPNAQGATATQVPASSASQSVGKLSRGAVVSETLSFKPTIHRDSYKLAQRKEQREQEFVAQVVREQQERLQEKLQQQQQQLEQEAQNRGRSRLLSRRASLVQQPSTSTRFESASEQHSRGDGREASQSSSVERQSSRQDVSEAAADGVRDDAGDEADGDEADGDKMHLSELDGSTMLAMETGDAAAVDCEETYDLHDSHVPAPPPPEVPGDVSVEGSEADWQRARAAVQRGGSSSSRSPRRPSATAAAAAAAAAASSQRSSTGGAVLGASTHSMSTGASRLADKLIARGVLIQQKKERLAEQVKEQEVAGCTFHPKINALRKVPKAPPAVAAAASQTATGDALETAAVGSNIEEEMAGAETVVEPEQQPQPEVEQRREKHRTSRRRQHQSTREAADRPAAAIASSPQPARSPRRSGAVATADAGGRRDALSRLQQVSQALETSRGAGEIDATETAEAHVDVNGNVNDDDDEEDASSMSSRSPPPPPPPPPSSSGPQTVFDRLYGLKDKRPLPAGPSHDERIAAEVEEHCTFRPQIKELRKPQSSTQIAGFEQTVGRMLTIKAAKEKAKDEEENAWREVDKRYAQNRARLQQGPRPFRFQSEKRLQEIADKARAKAQEKLDLIVDVRLSAARTVKLVVAHGEDVQEAVQRFAQIYGLRGVEMQVVMTVAQQALQARNEAIARAQAEADEAERRLHEEQEARRAEEAAAAAEAEAVARRLQQQQQARSNRRARPRRGPRRRKIITETGEVFYETLDYSPHGDSGGFDTTGHDGDDADVDATGAPRNGDEDDDADALLDGDLHVDDDEVTFSDDEDDVEEVVFLSGYDEYGRPIYVPIPPSQHTHHPHHHAASAHRSRSHSRDGSSPHQQHFHPHSRSHPSLTPGYDAHHARMHMPRTLSEELEMIHVDEEYSTYTGTNSDLSDDDSDEDDELDDEDELDDYLDDDEEEDDEDEDEEDNGGGAKDDGAVLTEEQAEKRQQQKRRRRSSTKRPSILSQFF